VAQLLSQYDHTDDQPANLGTLHAIKKQLLLDLSDLQVIPELALKQTVKHISSRRIDPAKAADWASGKLSKWPKDPAQKDVYEPNYNLARCRVLKEAS